MRLSLPGITVYEFGALVPAGAGEIGDDVEGATSVPDSVFEWLEDECLACAEEKAGAWLRLTQRNGRRVVQVTSFVGVIRTPDGFQIEVLPKVGRSIGGGQSEARQLLIDMLSCLEKFRHIETARAQLQASRMPLLEVFIFEFLSAVEEVVKRGLRSDYLATQDNLFYLKGKLQVALHMRENLFRRDRFFTDYDEFSANRAENRLLRAALGRALFWSSSQTNLRLARELDFVFADIPASSEPANDFQKVRSDRGMNYYADALAWARLMLQEESPLTGAGLHHATSLLFPMEAVFEAFVAKNLARQVAKRLTLVQQRQSHHLVSHQDQSWFRLKPDLIIRENGKDRLVLDTKWKLLDASQSDRKQKYGLSQSDFYQMLAYGEYYLDGAGDVVLIYPRSDLFPEPLPPFDFPKIKGLRLWALPFCLKSRRLIVPDDLQLSDYLSVEVRSDVLVSPTHLGNLPAAGS